MADEYRAADDVRGATEDELAGPTGAPSSTPRRHPNSAAPPVEVQPPTASDMLDDICAAISGASTAAAPAAAAAAAAAAGVGDDASGNADAVVGATTTNPAGAGGEGRTREALKVLIQAAQEQLGSIPARRAQGSVPAVRRYPPEKCVLLKVTVVEGRALVGELVDERTTASSVHSFSVDLQFNAQKARTRKEVRCCVEPKFGEAFVFVLRQAHELPATAGGWASFLQQELPLHIVLTKGKATHPYSRARSRHGAGVTGKEGGEDEEEWSTLRGSRRELVGTAEVDWRRALVPASGAQEGLHESGGILLAVELASAAPDSIVHPVGGILVLRLEVIAPSEVSSFPFKASDVKRIMDLQVSVRSEARRDFYLYADAWWKDFTSSSRDLRKRSVKIFAEDERGQHRCVCSFLEPYRRGRLLPTPRHAARFVSLLPFQRRASVGNQTVQSWNSPHSFLSAGRGDASDHALLLCSLLLGFGLDAFVCIGMVHPSDEDDTEAVFVRHGGADVGGGPGQADETGHMWVCTFSGRRADKKAFFWETLTGQRFSMVEPRLQKGRRTGKGTLVSVTPHHFSKVSCMFSHREFFANKQADNRVRRTSLDISDPNLWKPMATSRTSPQDMSPSTGAGPAGVVLFRPDVDAESMAEDVELELKRRVEAWREGNEWSTIWDDELGYLLGPSLFSYEQERVDGASFGSGDFQDAIQGAVPDRHCFKGYPTCFDHWSCGKIMSSLIGNAVSHDILSSNGDHLRFSLRSVVFAYPDGVVALWIMLACRFEAPAVV